MTSRASIRQRRHGMNAGEQRTWRVVGPDGELHESPTPGVLGGHRRNRIYGRLGCPSALRAIARGGYVINRVFFASEHDAIAAGYRPCSVCLPGAYAAWKANVGSPDRREILPRTSRGGADQRL